jgi:hypothetical protein
MKWNFSGNTSGTTTSDSQDLPNLIESFSVVNKTAGAITFNIYKIESIYNISITPLNKSLGAAEIYESTRPVVLLATELIKVQVSGSTDFDFTISNLLPD